MRRTEPDVTPSVQMKGEVGLLLDTIFSYNEQFLKFRSGGVEDRGEFCRSGRHEHSKICKQLTAGKGPKWGPITPNITLTKEKERKNSRV